MDQSCPTGPIGFGENNQTKPLSDTTTLTRMQNPISCSMKLILDTLIFAFSLSLSLYLDDQYFWQLVSKKLAV